LRSSAEHLASLRRGVHQHSSILPERPFRPTNSASSDAIAESGSDRAGL
jgi:hypothetical protein